MALRPRHRTFRPPHFTGAILASLIASGTLLLSRGLHETFVSTRARARRRMALHE
ncbi:MAG TPA: hypothetical protein VNO21_18085 [Polyangiaceae bacterium]|nr:hypothetical protein [Polyangiaceae bacterium]